MTSRKLPPQVRHVACCAGHELQQCVFYCENLPCLPLHGISSPWGLNGHQSDSCPTKPQSSCVRWKEFLQCHGGYSDVDVQYFSRPRGWGEARTAGGK